MRIALSELEVEQVVFKRVGGKEQLVLTAKPPVVGIRRVSFDADAKILDLQIGYVAESIESAAAIVKTFSEGWGVEVELSFNVNKGICDVEEVTVSKKSTRRDKAGALVGDLEDIDAGPMLSVYSNIIEIFIQHYKGLKSEDALSLNELNALHTVGESTAEYIKEAYVKSEISGGQIQGRNP